MKIIGYWYDPDGEHRWPHPRRLRRSHWDLTLKSKIVDYLRSGRRCMAYRGWSYCRFGCGRNGDSELTDGVFVWPEGLAHYVGVHDVRLPEEFLEHSRSMRFTIPIDRDDKLSRRREYDIEFWMEWCGREAPPSWRDVAYHRFQTFLYAACTSLRSALRLRRGMGDAR